jgi:hypothetical protein
MHKTGKLLSKIDFGSVFSNQAKLQTGLSPFHGLGSAGMLSFSRALPIIINILFS